MAITRRSFCGSLAGGLAGLPLAQRAALAELALPARPLTLAVVDVTGSLVFTRPAIERYRAARPGAVERFVFSGASAPALAAQLAAGRADVDLVLADTDMLSAGLAQDLWTDLAPHAAALPRPEALFVPQAARMQALAGSRALCIACQPCGPLIEYLPGRVAAPPDTAEALLAWARQNPRKFAYARPATSEPGRTFLMGLPYILGDADPRDPARGWTRTWDYLAALGETVESYPAGAPRTLQDLGEGTRDIVVSTTGWDLAPRALGVVPAATAVGVLQGTHWITSAQYLAVPRSLPDGRLAVLLDLMGFLLETEQQALAFDRSPFHPAPAAKGVTLDMAPRQSREMIRAFDRPAYQAWLAEAPLVAPLDTAGMITAARLWDERIGARKR